MIKNRLLIAAGAFGLAASPCVLYAQAFTDITASSGLQFHHEAEPMMPIGAGAAWVDVDGDGDDDLYAVQGDGCNRLYLNNGAGTFTEVANAAGAAECASMSHGVSASDYDNDGDQDLHVTNMGQNHLFKNQLVETGSLAFVDVTVAAGLDGDGAYNSSSSVWGDYDKDGDNDLFVGNHAYQMMPIACWEDYLWRNNGDGTFTNVASDFGIALSGVRNKAGCSLASKWTDFDNDRDLDLMVINDFGNANNVPNRLFRNDGSDGAGGWIFTDISLPSGFNYAQAGMGIAIGDLDHNGLFDYYSSDAGANELAYNNGNGTFTEMAGPLGVQANDQPIYGGLGLISWGTGFFDLDNDSWEELIVVNGGAPQDKFPGFFEGANYIQQNPAYVYRNRWAQTGAFTEVHTPLGVVAQKYYRSFAASDIDNDGDIDMYFGNLQGNNTLYRNHMANQNQNRWLKVRAHGTLGNRDAVGTRVDVSAAGVTLMREVDGGSSFLSRHSLTTHFGLKANTSADLEVRFLHGGLQNRLFVATNQTIDVTEPLMSADFVQKKIIVAQGQPQMLDLTVTNHSAQVQQQQMWFVYTPDGVSETVIGGPVTLTLQPGQSINRVYNVPTVTGMPTYGQRPIGVRLGTFGVETKQRDHARVVVIPAS